MALVTGATGAIGEAIAHQLARQPAYEVVLVCRDRAKAKAAVSRILAATGNNQIRYAIADLASKSSIEALAQAW